ncbi:isopentenyl-diphosphate Delta-isomerase [Candidatus Microgenomates bacterium]|nr:MAG: isopentenyl-diphosphate Delta-isomerase [Candidatus Microgenomates bacterium]
MDVMEQVILVDEFNKEIGVADKATVHTSNTPLHRAFSLFLFDPHHQLLVTQRALTKKTFAGVWSNTMCGHVSPGETTVEAAHRRLKQELGITASEIIEVAPYRYRFADQNGIVENEICPILVAYSFAYPRPNYAEIAAWRWMPWVAFLAEIRSNPKTYSPWCIEEAQILESKKLLKFAKK